MSALAAITALTQAALREVPLPFACSSSQLRLRDCLTGILQAVEQARMDDERLQILVATQEKAVDAFAAASSSASELYAAAKKEANEFGNRLASANDLAATLLFAMDEQQPHYEPRPHSEVVGLVHDLLSALDGDDDQPTTPGTAEMASDMVELVGVSQ